MIYISKELYLYISFVIKKKKRKKNENSNQKTLCTECTTMNVTLGIKGEEGDNI